MLVERTEIRNLAIIAHVDHGKTTLVNGLLKQAHVFHEKALVADRVMDSNDLERERGLTILAKNTAITVWDPETEQEVKINIVDTPGHADFGGEVERVMNMVDGVLLLVDAAEGPMPQTRFVLKEALEKGRRAVVVVNKVDRKNANPRKALNQTFDLFLELGASDEQADFPVVYTNAVTGQASLTPGLGPDLQPLFETILRHIPAPKVDVDVPLQMLVSTLGYDEYRGTTAVGRISAGKLRAGQRIARIKLDGEVIYDEAPYLFVHKGLERVKIDEAEAGGIVVVAGLEDVAIGETLADPDQPVALPAIEVEEPTVRMTFGVNTSPLAGQEGRWVTSRKLRERLFNELRRNVALRVEETDSAEAFLVSGRGELHLAILMEEMRREGYEFEISRPEVILRESEDGELLEPYEEVHIETTRDTMGTVIELLGSRQGQMINMQDSHTNSVHLTFLLPTRGLLGFRYQFLAATRGMGVMNTLFYGYAPLAGEVEQRTNGSLVAWERGVATVHGLENAEERGRLFIRHGTEVYAGMVIGKHQRPGDLEVNVCKQKQVTNVRRSFKEIDERLTPPHEMSLDEAIEYLADDELLEVTPETFRIRKKILDTEKRRKAVKRAKEAVA